MIDEQGRSVFGISVAGLGVVGSGLLRLLQREADRLTNICGRPIRVLAVSARDRNKKRDMNLCGARWFSNPLEMVREVPSDAVVEVIGGSDGVALELSRSALLRSRHLVTANKALLAHHAIDLGLLAESKGLGIGYEAAVAGGIPVIRSLREGLSGVCVERVYGILNGTCNAILSDMQANGRPFSDALRAAQDAGFAEADPALDVDGIDAAHKLALLAGLIFGARVDFSSLHVEGIRALAPIDLDFAREMGYCVKLLGIAQWRDGKADIRVHPTLIPLSSSIAGVGGCFNAVVAQSASFGSLMLVGPGAGAEPTAAALVSDLVSLAQGVRPRLFSQAVERLSSCRLQDISEHVGRMYVRFQVFDRPGVIADISACLRDHGISIRAMIQHDRARSQEGSSDGGVSLVLITHRTREQDIDAALSSVASLDCVCEQPVRIRMEDVSEGAFEIGKEGVGLCL